MNRTRKNILLVLALTAVISIISACSTTTDGNENEGTDAFVDDVIIKLHLDHSYATVSGHYPDACSRVNNVQQSVGDSSIEIVLTVDRPADMMCAQMLTPFEVDILLETGGLSPGEYTVTVNEARSTTLTIGG